MVENNPVSKKKGSFINKLKNVAEGAVIRLDRKDLSTLQGELSKKLIRLTELGVAERRGFTTIKQEQKHEKEKAKTLKDIAALKQMVDVQTKDKYKRLDRIADRGGAVSAATKLRQSGKICGSTAHNSIANLKPPPNPKGRSRQPKPLTQESLNRGHG